MTWFGVRCVIEMPEREIFEERITIWQASSHEEAIGKAEVEARAYAEGVGASTGFAQSYELTESPGDGVEVFSLMRESRLAPSDYLNQFFDTGLERQRDAD